MSSENLIARWWYMWCWNRTNANLEEWSDHIWSMIVTKGFLIIAVTATRSPRWPRWRWLWWSMITGTITFDENDTVGKRKVMPKSYLKPFPQHDLNSEKSCLSHPFVGFHPMLLQQMLHLETKSLQHLCFDTLPPLSAHHGPVPANAFQTVTPLWMLGN